MSTEITTAPENARIRRLTVGSRRFTIIGAPHLRDPTSDLVRETIETERPDIVYIEMDRRRFESLADPDAWQDLDLRDVMRRHHVTTLIAQIILLAYQKKMGDVTGVSPGMRMVDTAKLCDDLKIPWILGDRDIRITLLRTWRLAPPARKPLLLTAIIANLLDSTAFSSERLDNPDAQDALAHLMHDVESAYPDINRILRDERDDYLALRARESTAVHTLVVVGPGHLNGVANRLQYDVDATFAELEQVPPASPTLKWIAWTLPLVIIGSVVVIAIKKGATAAGENILFWIVVNSVPCAAGAALAAAHPLTVLTAFVAAPITSLTPVFGAGYASAMMETWLRPPRVREIHDVGTDAILIRKWWTNRTLRILLIFFLSGFGSILGTWIGGLEIMTNVF